MVSKNWPTLFLTGVVALSSCDKSVCADGETKEKSKETASAERAGKASQSPRNKVLDRYWKILIANPREGAAFDRVYYDYVGRGEGDALLAELKSFADKGVGEEKGKRLYLLALAQIRRSAPAEAVETLREAEAASPESAQILRTLGKTLSTLGRFEEARDAWKRALDKELSDDDRVEVLEKLGETYVRLALFDEADAVWNEAIRRYSNRPDVLKRVAETQAASGRYREAAQLFTDLEKAARERRDVEAEIEFAVAVGDMKIRLGERDEAIGDFERAIGKLAPSHWLFKSLRDRVEYILLQRSDYGVALDYYRRIVEKNPADLDAAARLAAVLGALGKYAEAEETLNDALKRAPKSVALRQTALELALTQNLYDVADRLLGELDELGANDEDAALLWGDVALKNDRLDFAAKRKRATEVWSRLIDDKNRNVATALLVAEKCAQNNFRAEAEKILIDLANANPNDFEVCANVAGFYFNGGDAKKAFAALDAFAKRNPKDVRAWLRRAEFLRERGHANEAVDAARRAVELAAENLAARLLLIDLETDAGNFKAVEAEVEAARALAETDDEKNRLFAARMRFLTATNRVREYLDSLDAILGDENVDDATRAETYWYKTSCFLATLDPNGAVEAAIEALERGAISDALLRKIPEVAAKSQAPERTLVLLDVASDKDPANKATYLRAAANVKLELGALDDAAQTARELLALDPGNAANCRTCADVLWACGLVEETTGVLRKAAELDSVDKASQMKLASLLDETGATADAVDLLWPIFEKSTRIEEKLNLIDELARLYVKIDRFEILKDRLESSAKTETERRENAYCLSRAYASIKDYDSARSTLETYLTFVKNRGADDAFLLNALSTLAEAQNDLASAIRYQETLCEIDDSLPERERLLDLYRRSSDKSKARRYLTQKILPREPLWRQLETVDVLASMQNYDEAAEILTEVEKRRSVNWEIAARRVSLAGWLDDESLPRRVAELRAFNEAESALSSKTTELASQPETPSTTIAGDAWLLGEARGRAVLNLNSPKDLRDFAAQIATVVYRDRLTLSDRNVRSLYATASKPQAPTQAYLTFGAALFEAFAWETKNEPAALLAALEKDAASGAELDVAALKKRFALAEYALTLLENVGEFKGLPLKELQDVVDETIVELAKRDDEWRVEAAPIVLERLIAATDETEARERARFLTTTLEKALADVAAPDAKALWTRANEIANALKNKGLNEEAKRTGELILAAGARDYSVFLNAEISGERRSFESFAQTIKTAEELAIKQVRNASDVERAWSAFGAAFTSRLQSELKEAFKDCDPEAGAKAEKTFEIWTKLSEKVGFGRSTSIFFARTYRRELFEDATALDEETREAFKRYEESVYETLAFAAETDARLGKAFAEKASRGAATSEPLADSLRFVGRDRRTAVRLAAFLVNSAIYGTQTRAPRSLFEGGKPLEFALGTLFAADVAESAEDVANCEFTRVAKLVDFVVRNLTPDVGGAAYTCGRRCVELATTVEKTAKDETQLESSEELKALALENLTAKEGEGKPEDAKLLIALAILALAEDDDAAAIAYLDRTPRATFADVKALELVILETFAGTENPETQARKNAAADALLGRRLDEEEATRLYEALIVENRLEDAEKIRRRLTMFATNCDTLNMLLDKILEENKNGAEIGDDEIVFALKIFKSSTANSGDAESRAKIRGKALAVLKAGGKLVETREDLERFLSNAPGAVESAMRLVDVEIERGEAVSAKNILEMLESRLPNDPAIYSDYASALVKVGEIEKAKRFVKQGFTQDPKGFFAAGARPEFWTLADDLEFLRELDLETIAAFALPAFHIAIKAANDENLADEGVAAIARLWNDASSPETRNALRTAGARLLAQTEDPRFFTYVRDRLLECVEPNAEPNGTYGDYEDVCRVVYWSDDEPQVLSTRALNMVDEDGKNEKLEAFLARLREYIATYEARENENPARQSGAIALEIQTLLKLGRVEEAVERATSARKGEVFCAPGFKNDALAVCLAFEGCLDAAEREKYSETLREFYEIAYAENRHPAYEEFYVSKLYPLGAKSVNSEIRMKYVNASLSEFRSLFRSFATADLSSNTRIGGALQTVETFALYTQALREAALSDGGARLAAIFEETGVAKRLKEDEFATATPEWRAYIETLRELAAACGVR